MKLVRMLRGFEKRGDELVFEFALESFPLDELRALYSFADDDPLYDCIPLSKDAERLIRRTNTLPALDYDNLEYFLECDAEYPDE